MIQKKKKDIIGYFIYVSNNFRSKIPIFGQIVKLHNILEALNLDIQKGYSNTF